MSSFLLRIFFIFCLIQGSLEAAFSLEDLVSLTESKDSTSEELQPPDPMQLDPNWWNYFKVDGPELDKRVAATDVLMQKLYTETPEQNKEEIEEHLQRILINLKALPGLRNQKVSTYTAPPLLNSYSFDQFLQIAASEKELEGSLAQEDKELRQLKDRTNKVRKHIDTLLVSYLEMHEANVTKEMAGLEIISLRTALAIMEEDIRISSERYTQINAELNHAKEELSTASENLLMKKEDIANLDQDIQKARIDLKAAQFRSLTSEMNAVGASGDTALERSKGFLSAQQAVLDLAKEALSKADLIFYQAKSSLISEDLEDLGEWQDQLSQIKAQLADWRTKTEQEYTRALQPLAGDEKVSQVRLQTVQETLKVLKQLELKLTFDELLVKQLKSQQAKKGGTALYWYYSVLGWFDTCCDPVVGWLYAPLIKIGGVPITVMSLLRIFAIILVTFCLSHFLRTMLKRMKKDQMHLTEASAFIIDRLIHYVVLCIGFALALASIGLSLSNLALVLGALSVGIGFGLQTIVNNFLSSLIIMFSRTLKVGDMVEIADGQYGQVTSIHIQNTVIHTGDGADIVVPNSEILSNKLINWSLQDNFRRLHIPFSVAYGTDKELLTQAVSEAAEKVPCTVRNSAHYSEPQVWFVHFGDSSLDFELVVWVNVFGYGHKGSMNTSYLWEIENSLRKYGIDVPFPQREIRVLPTEAKTTTSSIALNN